MIDGPSAGLPEPGEGKRGEAGYLGYLLRQAAGAFRRRLDAALADLDLTTPQFAVLTLLNAYPGASNADLARLALLTPQTLTVIVANLEKRGALTRRPHADHGRIRQLTLTEAGTLLHETARQRSRALDAEIAGTSTAEELRIIRSWLARLARDQGGPPT